MSLAEPALWSATSALVADEPTPWHWVVIAVAAVGEVLSVVFVYRVLVRGGSAASTLLWMALILVAPWLGLLLYYLMPRRVQLKRLRHIRKQERRLRDAVSSQGDASLAAGAADREHSGLEALLEARGGLSSGNELRWLPSGGDFFAAAAAVIASAQHHVHCVVYILRPDETGLRFLDLLTEAATRGVKVRLCFDSVGSWGLKSSHLRELRAAGGHAVPFFPLLWKRRPFTLNLRNHRKLLVADGEVGFVGGRNIADEYRLDRVERSRRWYDAMMEVRGPAVDQLQDVFVQDWCTATDEVLADTFRPPRQPAGPCRVGVVGCGPDEEPSVLWFALVQAISEAQRTIDLSSPYLVLPPTLLFALQLATARGVRVRVFTNGPSAEAAFLYHAQRHRYRSLLDSNVEILETVQQYNHTKFLVVDERTVCIGSANMDLRSAHLNFEVAAVALDAKPLAAAIQATIDERQPDFRQITKADLPKNPFLRALDGVCGLFAPLL
jgi:cardiolipin synthase A/B